MFKSMVLSVLLIIGLILALIVTYYVFRVLKTLIIAKVKKKSFKQLFFYTQYSKLFDFAKWAVYDLLRGKDYSKLYGIWAFAGYYGQGKTMGAVTFANYLKVKYPYKGIRIYTNFEMVGQDGKVERWEDLLELPPNTILVFDEIQSTFSSQRFKDFPMDLLAQLTQCRKDGLMVLCSSPVYSRMVIQIRESVDFVITCRNTLGLDRFFRYSFYHRDVFEKYEYDEKQLRKNRSFALSFVATDQHYNQYDTKKKVDRMDIEGEDKSLKLSSKLSKDDIRNMIQKEIDNKLKNFKPPA